MKLQLTLTIPLLAAILSTTGCSTLLSTEALVTDAEAITDPALAGVWTKDADTIVVRENGKAYSITYSDNKDAMKFTGRLTRSGDALLLDLARESDDPFLLPLHFAVRVWPDGRTLRWTMLDTNWLKDQAESRLTTAKDGDRTIVTAPRQALRETILKLGSDERAHEKVEVWQRLN